MERPPPNRLRQRTPARRVREFVPVGLLALACGAVLHEPLGCGRGAAPANPPKVAVGATSGVSAPSFESLAARGPAVAPGMREVTRTVSAGDKVEIARAGGRDACVRVVFEASSPVVARLLDGEGNVLASSEAPAIGGVLGERGPVCVRKGETVMGVAEGTEPSVRWVAWESP